MDACATIYKFEIDVTVSSLDLLRACTSSQTLTRLHGTGNPMSEVLTQAGLLLWERARFTLSSV